MQCRSITASKYQRCSHRSVTQQLLERTTKLPKDHSRQRQSVLREQHSVSSLLERFTGKLRFLLNSDLVLLHQHSDGHDAFQFGKTTSQTRTNTTTKGKEGISWPVLLEPRGLEGVGVIPVKSICSLSMNSLLE